MTEDNSQLRRIIEGSILAAGEPLSLQKIQSLFGEEEDAPEKEALLEALKDIQEQCEGRGFELVEVASGWRFQVRADVATWVNRLWEEKPQKYSRALLETLALVAYRQPLTRGDIEEVRGVAVSSHIIKTLTEREWVKVVGHRDVPGRPALYATTKMFLDYFNLKSLDELPTLGDLKDIDGLNQALEFDENMAAASGDETDEAAQPAADIPEEAIADDGEASSDSDDLEDTVEAEVALSSEEDEESIPDTESDMPSEEYAAEEALSDDEEESKQPSDEASLND